MSAAALWVMILYIGNVGIAVVPGFESRESCQEQAHIVSSMRPIEAACIKTDAR